MNWSRSPRRPRGSASDSLPSTRQTKEFRHNISGPLLHLFGPVLLRIQACGMKDIKGLAGREVGSGSRDNAIEPWSTLVNILQASGPEGHLFPRSGVSYRGTAPMILLGVGIEA